MASAIPVTVTREQEIWALALWVEQHHEADGHGFIADRIASLEGEGEQEGGALWRAVERRYAQLRTGIIPIHGEPGSQPN